jgi:YggT family protein
MFILGNLVLAVANILDIVLTIYMWIVIIAALISWISPDPYNPIVRFLYSVTEPVFSRIRRVIGFSLGAIDISPLIVILAIIFTRRFLINSLIELGYKLKGGAFI